MGSGSVRIARSRKISIPPRANPKLSQLSAALTAGRDRDHVQTNIDSTKALRFAFPAIPKEVYRCTLEDHGDHVRNAEAYDYAHKDPHHSTHSRLDHDTKVESKDRHLTQGFRAHVHEVSHVQPFKALGDVVRWNPPHVSTKPKACSNDDGDVHAE